jgi:exo-beta-1,3-glucanase (GH17 family)
MIRVASGGATGVAEIRVIIVLPSPCIPSGPLPEAFLTCRNWITFAPPHPFDPTRGVPVHADSLRVALRQLYEEGWRGLVTYSLDPTQELDSVPRIAKEVGFAKVVAGLFWFDDAQLARERPVALSQAQWIDAYVVGSEGLEMQRYSCTGLKNEVARLRQETGRPVATSEPDGQYLSGNCPDLVSVGEWVFPNIHPWFANIRSIPEAVQNVEDRYRALVNAAPGRTVVTHEAWWPTAGGTEATEENQSGFFGRLSATSVVFIWGEAYDQIWKTQEGPQGPHWGLHADGRIPKQLVDEQRPVYRGPY